MTTRRSRPWWFLLTRAAGRGATWLCPQRTASEPDRRGSDQVIPALYLFFGSLDFDLLIIMVPDSIKLQRFISFIIDT